MDVTDSVSVVTSAHRRGAVPRLLRRTLLSALVCLLLSVLAPTAALATILLPVPVNFPDPGLNTAVRAAIGKPTGQIYASDLATLTTVTAEMQGITHLDGLEYATNLTQLDLRDNNVTTITPISGLTKLTSLDLGDNNVTTITPVSGLVNLASLDLGVNKIADIGPLQGLANLTSLDLMGQEGDTQLVDIWPIMDLKKLNSLNVASNAIYDINPLLGLNAGLSGHVDISNNWVDLSPGTWDSTVVGLLGVRGYSVTSMPQNLGGVVIGSVHSTTGEALGAVDVNIASGPQAYSAGDGDFVFQLVEPGSHTITFSAPYYHDYSTQFLAGAGATSTIDVALVPVQLPVSISCSPNTYSVTYKRKKGVAKFSLAATLSDARGRVAGAFVWLEKSSNGKKWSNLYKLKTNSSGSISAKLSIKKKGTTYYRWSALATAADKAGVTGKQKVVVK